MASKRHSFKITVETEGNGRDREWVHEMLEGEIQGMAFYVEDEDGEESEFSITAVV